jgi:site-specific recombinase XerD
MEEILKKYSEFLLARGLSQNYHNSMRIFLPFIKSKNIEFNSVTQDILTEFFNSNNYSLNSKNMYIKAGRNYGDYLQLSKELNAFYQIKLMKVASKIPECMDEHDISEAKKYLITYESKRIGIPKINALLDFLFFSGIRKTELLTLKRIDFHLEENYCKVLGKGNKERLLCFPITVSKEIQEYFISEPESINAFNMTRGKINYIAIQIGKYLGKRVYCHLFRHSFARNLNFNKGVDTYTISKLLGHSSMTTTLLYISPDEKTIRNTYKKLVG